MMVTVGKHDRYHHGTPLSPTDKEKRVAFNYSDGTEIENDILGLLDQARDLGSDVDLAPEAQARSWPVRYHLSAVRPNLLRHFSFEGLNVLELGAGMGALSRFLAERAETLTLIEPSSRRLQAACKRLADLKNWQAHRCRIEDFSSPNQFDVVTLIGVLEYAELFGRPGTGDGLDAFDQMLQHAASHLRPGGILLLAIENRLGIKYWSGVGEDHTGGLFDGIVGYPCQKTVRTFDLAELEARLDRADLNTLRRYLPFPDYKMPSCVLDARLAEQDIDLVVDLACFRSFEDPLRSRVQLFPDYLALHGAARAGLFAEFSNSFLLAACNAPVSLVLDRLLRAPSRTQTTAKATSNGEELGWHYSPDRRQPCRTVFCYREGKVWADKHRRSVPGGQELEQAAGISWQRPTPQLVIKGERFRHRLLRQLYFSQHETYIAELEQFLTGVLLRHRQNDGLVHGSALDALWTNATRTTEESRFFDLEWSLQGGIAPSWFVLRNVLATSADVAVAGLPGVTHLAELYEILCRRLEIQPDIEADLQRESAFQNAVRRVHPQDLTKTLRHVFFDRQHSRPPRRPDDLLQRHHHIEEHNRQLQEHSAKLEKRNEKLALTVSEFTRLETSMTQIFQTVSDQARLSERQEQQLAASQRDLAKLQSDLADRTEQARASELHQATLAQDLSEALVVLSSRRHRWIELCVRAFRRRRRAAEPAIHRQARTSKVDNDALINTEGDK